VDGAADGTGVFFIHGMNAHSHWWDFIAPQFAADYRVAAMDLTGMGDSDATNTTPVYASEIVAVLDAAGSAPTVSSWRTVLVATCQSKRQIFPDRFAGLILVDPASVTRTNRRGTAADGRTAKEKYPDRETALTRFRLQPPQTCENQYILDYVARHSLMPADGGWTWSTTICRIR
jgi:pimeloyl-ACP methyl ester carboxylesterase